MRLLLAGLLALAPCAAAAGMPVELPPGEDPAAWAGALDLARQLLPGLELGPALGPGASVRLLPVEGAWLLDSASSSGRSAPLRVAIPQDEHGRIELLLVCAEVLARGAEAPPPPAAAPTEEPAPAPRTRWLGPRAALGLGVLPAPSPRFLAFFEPVAVGLGPLGLGPLLALGSGEPLGDGLSLRSGYLGAELALGAGRRPAWRGGIEAGFSLRGVARDGDPLLRDWSAALAASGSAGWTFGRGWRVALGLRGQADLPPAELSLGGERIALPVWTLATALEVATPDLAPQARRVPLPAEPEDNP